MARYVSLNKDEHLKAGFLKTPDMQYAQSDLTVPLLIEEVPFAITTMPIMFTRKSTADAGNRDGDIAQYEMCALLSLAPGNNLFVTRDGRWLAGYMPAEYRAYPFKALPKPGTGELTLCFNTDSGLLLDNPGSSAERFFTDEGEPVELLKSTMQFLQKCEKNRQITNDAVASLARHNLLTPFKVKVKVDQGEPRLLEGLYTIDEKILRKLSPQALEDLNKNNGLSIAYAQLYAQHRLKDFNKLYEIRRRQSDGETPADISGILSSDSTLQFN